MLKKGAFFWQNNWLLFCGLILAILIFSLFIFNFMTTRLARADTATSAVSVGNAPPTVDSISLNGGSNINLNEGTFKWASSTVTATDNNGCNTMTVSAKLYRTTASTVGTSCSQNDNNCYVAGSCAATTTGNTCDGSSDPTAEYDCGFRLWYIADPTDAGAYAGDIWAVAATTTDGSANGTATNAGQLIEVISLNALDITANINHGSLTAGENTGTTNQTLGATTTGNTAIDAEVNGSRYMCSDWDTCAADTIDVWNQKYDLVDQTYSSLTYYLTSTSTPQLELTNVKPTSTTSPETDLIYWGLNVPGGTPTGTYNGTTTLTAVSD